MNARPILFSGPMVKALLEGRKSQTRRAIKPQPPTGAAATLIAGSITASFDTRRSISQTLSGGSTISQHHRVVHCPYGAPGDLLYVRESFSYYRGEGLSTRGATWKWADGNPGDGDWTRPKPGIHMPRWASRLTLELTDVRVQRLQEISVRDAIAEGAAPLVPMLASVSAPEDYLVGYRALWESINGAGSWAANQWVWVLTFFVRKANVDRRLALKAAKESLR